MLACVFFLYNSTALSFSLSFSLIQVIIIGILNISFGLDLREMLALIFRNKTCTLRRSVILQQRGRILIGGSGHNSFKDYYG